MATATLEPLASLPDPGEPDGLYEVVDGRIVEKPMGVYEYWLAGLFFGAIDRYTEDHPVGQAVVEMMFDLRPHVDRERRPDGAFISFERWGPERPIPQSRAWAVIPDLAVEILSPTNPADEIVEKLEEYFKVGVRQVWVVYPRQRKIYVYRSVTAVEILASGDQLDGGDILPGFRRSVQSLFDKVRGPA